MSLSSSVIISRKSSVLLSLVLAFFLAFSSMASADMKFDRFAVQNNGYPTKDSTTTKSLYDVLSRAGVLPIIHNLVPELGELLKNMEKMFHSLEKDRHAHDLNKIMGHLKDTWFNTFDNMRVQGTDILDVNTFHSFLVKYQELLDKAVTRDRELDGSDVVQFMAQLEHLFHALDSAYAVAFLSLKDYLNLPYFPFRLDWDFFSSKSQEILQKLPADIFDPNMLRELTKIPREMMGQLTTYFDEKYDELMKSPVGHMVPMLINMIPVVVNMIKNMPEQNRHNMNREEF